MDLSATLSPAVDGETISFTLNGASAGSATTDASGVATLSGVSLLGIDAGSYPAGVSTSFAGDANYIASSDSDSLTVNPAPLTITADNASKVYGDPNPAFSVTYSGFTAGDDESDLLGTLGITTSATEVSPVGTYPITPSGHSSTNYSITFVDGTLTINSAPLTVTAGGASKVYGSSNPPFSVTYSGFKAGDNKSDLNGSLRIKTTAEDTSPVGTYPITPSRLSSDNYNITFVDGTLTVTAAATTIAATNDPDGKLDENIVADSGETSDIDVKGNSAKESGGSTVTINYGTLDKTTALTPDDEAEPTITVAGISSSGAIEVSEFTRLSPIILISGFCIVAIGLIVLFIHLSRRMKPRELVMFWLKMMR